jgi:hypothetical protein
MSRACPGGHVTKKGGAARERLRRFVHRESDYLTSSSSTSKISVAFGGIAPPAPREP